MRLRFLSSLAALGAGCVEDVPIAAECPPDRSGPCIVEVDGGEAEPPDVDPPPTARVDAGAPRDASPTAIGDAASSVPLPPRPALENRSFEFSNVNSTAGDVTTVSLGTMTQIDPWYTCQVIGGQSTNSITAVRAETGLTAGTTEGSPKVDVGPRDGKTFITIGYLVNIVPMPLLQRLSTPLRKGERYAFAIDALGTSPSAMLSLEVRGNNEGCLGGQSQLSLFKSPAITSSSWSTVCVSFPAPTDLSYLILAAEPNDGSIIDPAEMLIEGDPLGGPRLVFDNLREATAEECPEL